MYTIPDFPVQRQSFASHWPDTIPRPTQADPDDWSACRAIYNGAYMYDSGNIRIGPYPCRTWQCEQHHEDKAQAYFDQLSTYLVELDHIFIGWYRSFDDDERVKVHRQVRRRADRSDFWVRISAGSWDFWVSAADLGSSRASSAARDFYEVTRDEAETIAGTVLISDPSVRVSGSRTSTPRWLPPDRYATEPENTSGAKHITNMLPGKQGDDKLRRILRLAIRNMRADGHIITDKQEEHFITYLDYPPDDMTISGSKAREYVVKAGAAFTADHDNDREARTDGWSTDRTPNRHLHLIVDNDTDPDSETTEIDERTA